MSYRMKITLPDPTMAQLEALAEQRGEPASRIAAQMICAEIADGTGPRRTHSSAPVPIPAEDPDPDRRAPWIEPFIGHQEWRAQMWGSIVALYGRYPRELAHLKDLLRAGLLVAIGDPAADLEEASITWPKPPEAFTEPLMRIDAYRALLDLIEWAEPSSPEPPVKVWLHDHRWALTTALDDRLRIERNFADEDKNAAGRRARAEEHARLIEEFLARLKEK